MVPRIGVLAFLIALCLAAAHAGCGGAASSYQTRDIERESENPVELESEQVSLVEQLDTALSRTEPNCEGACDLGDAICLLGQRICAISERHETDDGLRGRCRDASERCDRARERITATCTCSPDDL